MTSSHIFYLLSFCFYALQVFSEVKFPNSTSFVALQTGVPTARCDAFGLCENQEDGHVVFGETMEKHLFPPSIWIETTNGTRYNAADPTRVDHRANATQLQIGDIVVYSANVIPVLRSAILLSAINPETEQNFFYRYIGAHPWFPIDEGSLDPRGVGYLVVQAPVLDPDSLFEPLAQDPLFAGVPAGLRSQVDPAIVIPSPTPDCRPDKCYQFIASADVFYFGLNRRTPLIFRLSQARHLRLQHPQYPCTRDPSSVYVVYQSMQIFDNCRHWLGGSLPFTASFRSDTLSTLEYKTDAPPATKVMNYADLPCPPPDVAQYLNPEVPYSPLLTQLFRTWATVNGSGALCEQPAIIDPPVRAVRVPRISGPKDGDDVIA